jgi:hypothetical protein
MPQLTDRNWNTIIQRIAAGSCTPFLGAGACVGSIPLGAELAKEWSKTYGFPFEDTSDLARVAQYITVALDRESIAIKEELCRRFINAKAPDFTDPDEPHAFLADLPLPVYMTTNYDGFMVAALKSRNRAPKQEFCRWNAYTRRLPSAAFGPDQTYLPSNAAPLVFHLHGYYETPASLVLTEDDYLDFLIGISRDQSLLPERIQQAFTDTSLLFLGYRLADPDFRVVFRGLVEYMERSTARAHVSVQLSPTAEDLPEERRKRIEDYLDSYFLRLNIQVYWGTCREFIAELKKRWLLFKGNGH